MYTLEMLTDIIREYSLIINNKRPGYNLKNCKKILKEYEERYNKLITEKNNHFEKVLDDTKDIIIRLNNK